MKLRAEPNAFWVKFGGRNNLDTDAHNKRWFTAAVCLAIAAFSGRPAIGSSQPKASVLTGTWKFEYPCDGVTGDYADRCAAGEHDDFILSIASEGGRLCGWYEITAQMDNHVDDGQLDDWTFTQTNPRTFDVKFHMSGNSGKAQIVVDQNKLIWKTKKVDAHAEQKPILWSFTPPHSATLMRQSPEQVRHAASCPQLR